MRLQPWKLLKASLLVSAPPWLGVYRESVELPSGRVLNDFYRVVLPQFAVVVATTSEGKLVMVRTYKHGLGRICLTAPSGLIEAGESPLDAARRELLEETGYSASRWECLGSFVVDGNRQCGTAHIFLARNATKVASVKEDDAEEIKTKLIPLHRFLQAVQDGDIPLLATVSAVALAIVKGLD
jgi:ADP-ribose pyrophosphatase